MSIQTEFQIGDLVKLKYGGPTMIYSGERYMFGDAICVWFEGTNRKDGHFPYAMLVKADTAA